MAENEHEFRIRIRGILDSSVAGALERMQAMMNRMQSTQQAYNNANRQANELRPYLKSLQAMQRQFDSMNKAKQKAGELSQSIRQSQQLLTQLTNQRVQAMQRVSEAERQRNTTRDRLNQTKAEQELIRSRQASIRENLRNLRAESGNESNRESIRRLTQELTELQRKSRELSETRKSQSSEATRANNQYRNSVRELEQIQRRIDTTENRSTNMQSRYQSQIEAIRRLRAELSSAGVDVQHLADAEARLRQQIEQTNSQLNQRQTRENRLNQAQSRFDQASFNANNAYSNFQNTVSTASSILSPIKDSVMVSAEFEKEMSKVQAISHASAEEKAQLIEKAREIGRTTQFKASEAAEAEKYMAMAGWGVKQQLAGLDPLTNLAAATDVGIQRASDVLTDLMTAFRIDTTQQANIDKFVDQVVMTTQKSNTDLEGVYQALKFAAPVAQTIGMTTAETLSFLGSMANSGIKDTNAGTAMRQIGLRIGGGAKNTKKAADAMGISLSDAQAQQMEAQLEMERLLGTERSKELNSIEDEGTRVFETMRAISEAFKGMSESEQVSSAQMLFGTTAVSGGLAVLKDFQSGDMDKLHGFVKNSEGVAAETAREMNDNLLGAITRFESAFESVSQTIGDIFKPMWRDLYSGATDYLGELETWVTENESLVRTLGTVAIGIAGIAVAGTGLFAAFTGIQYISSGIGLIATEITMLPNIFSVAASGIRGAFLSLAGLSLPVLAGLTLLAGAAYLIYDNWSIIGPVVSKTFTDIQTVLSGAMAYIEPAISLMSTGFDQIQSQLSTMDFSGITNALQQVALFLAGLVASLGVIGATIIAIFVELGAAVMETLGVAFRAIALMIQGDFTGAFNLACEAIKGIISGLAAHLTGTIGAAFDAVSGIVSRIGSAINSVGAIPISGGGLAQVAHNAAGGIYSKGAFLTTFAEDSAEAAIPLDGSRRAISLWQQAGQILGVYSSNSVSDLSQNANSVLQNASQILGVYSSNSVSDLSQNALSNANLLTQSENVSLLGRIEQILGVYSSVNSIPETGAVNTVSDLINTESNSNFMAPNVNIEFTINGNADREIMQESANRIVESIQQTFEEQYLAMLHERSRVAFT